MSFHLLAPALAALMAALPAQSGLVHDFGWLPEPLGPLQDARMVDVNGDGFLDLVRLRAHAVEVLVQDPATGRYARTADSTLASAPSAGLRAIAIGHFDASGDAFPDVAALGSNGVVDILLSDGLGGLTHVQPRPTPVLVLASGVDLFAGDLDGDGRDDLVALLEAVPPQYLHGLPNGTFVDVTASQMPAVGYPRPHATLVDIDGDLDLDLVLCSTNNLPPRLFSNTGGTFTDLPAAFGTNTVQAGSVLAVDLAGSALPDVVFCRPGNASLAPVVRVNVGGTFSTSSVPQVLRLAGVAEMIAYDWDGDGADDVLFLESDGSLGFALANNGSLMGWSSGSTGTTVPFPVLPPDPGRGFVASGDLEGDGDVDLLAGGNCLDSLLLFSPGAHHDVERTSFPSTWRARSYTGALVDRDGNGDLDLIGLQENGSWLAFDNDGSGRFEQVPVSIPPLPNTMSAASWDILEPMALDGPDARDLIALNSRTGSGTGPRLAVLVHGAGAWTDQTATRFSGSLTGSISAVATYRRPSGVDDLLLGTSAGTLEYHRNIGGVLTRQPGTFPGSLALGGVSDLIVEDFTGDGAADLLVLSSSPPLLMVRGALGFTPSPTSVSALVSGSHGIASDLDLDGDLDVLLREQGQSGITVLRWGNGSFTTATFGALGNVTHTIEDMATVRIDGLPRIVLTRGDDVDLEYAWNGTSYTGPTAISYRGTCASTRLMTADVDRDRDDDVLVFREHQDPQLLHNTTTHLMQLGPIESGRSGRVTLRGPAPGSLAFIAVGMRLDTPTPWGLLRLDPNSMGSLFLGVATAARQNVWNVSIAPGLPRIRFPMQAAWFTPNSQVKLSGLQFLDIVP